MPSPSNTKPNHKNNQTLTVSALSYWMKGFVCYLVMICDCDIQDSWFGCCCEPLRLQQF